MDNLSDPNADISSNSTVHINDTDNSSGAVNDKFINKNVTWNENGSAHTDIGTNVSIKL